jgi:hypothetical protein
MTTEKDYNESDAIGCLVAGTRTLLDHLVHYVIISLQTKTVYNLTVSVNHKCGIPLYK